MNKSVLFGNVMPTPLGPVATGNAKADEAFRRWP
jgi:hypothetical protein